MTSSGKWDGFALQCLLNKLGLFFEMDLEKTGGCCGRWKATHILDVLYGSPVYRFHGSTQPRSNVIIGTHVHRLFLAPHDFSI